jgi:hypothetical protein
MRCWVQGRRSSVVVAAVIVTAAGCWPSSGAGPDRRGYNGAETIINTASVATMHEAWTVEFGAGPVSDPIREASGPVFVVASDADHGSRSVYAVGTDGSVSWELDGQAGGTEQYYDGELIVVDGELGVSTRDLDDDIEQQWSHRWHDILTAEPVGPTWRGRLEARRGAIALASNTNDDTMPQPFSLYGHQLEGFEGWGGFVGNEIPPTLGQRAHYQPGFGMTNDDYPPTFGNGVRNYPNADQGTNCVLDYMCPGWAVPVDGQSATPVVLGPGEEILYTVTDIGTVYAINSDGTTRWTASVGAPVSETPALANGWLYVPADDGRLLVFSADGCGTPTCAPVWSAATGSRISAQPAIGGDVVFTASADGSVHAFAAAGCGATTCTDLWSTEIGSEVTGAPAVSGGLLYLGTADGRLIAFQP